MRVLKYEELVSHGVLEFCYTSRYPEHWNPDSVFIDYDDFVCLSPYLEQVFPNYPYFASLEVTIEQWEKIECLTIEEEKEDKYRKFFREIREWKSRDPERSKTFWIYGV